MPEEERSGEEPSTVTPVDPVPRRGSADALKPIELRGLGKAGVAFLVIGAASSVGGLGLALRPDEPLKNDPVKATKIASTKPLGFGLLGGGAVLLITGAVLLGVDPKWAKERRAEANSSGPVEAAVHPWLGLRGPGIAVSGRF